VAAAFIADCRQGIPGDRLPVDGRRSIEDVKYTHREQRYCDIISHGLITVEAVLACSCCSQFWYLAVWLWRYILGVLQQLAEGLVVAVLFRVYIVCAS